jgi:hypothetical protein
MMTIKMEGEEEKKKGTRGMKVEKKVTGMGDRIYSEIRLFAGTTYITEYISYFWSMTTRPLAHGPINFTIPYT